MIDKLDEKFRPCVGAMIINDKSQIWIGKRITKIKKEGLEEISNYKDRKLWQMPQGGIDPGEEPEEAVFREVYEETGLKDIKILAVSDHWYQYKIPKTILNNYKGKFIGQTQKWFLLQHLGNDNDVNLVPDENSGNYQEFADWKWENPEKILDQVIDFKTETYKKVLKEFENIRML